MKDLECKVYITKRFGFEAAHRLDGYDGDCSKLHGHSYKVEVTVSGSVLNTENVKDNMVLDFKELGKYTKFISDIHDHTILNDLYLTQPTAEMVSIAIYYYMKEVLPKDVKVESVKVWETENSYAEYRGECENV